MNINGREVLVKRIERELFVVLACRGTLPVRCCI